MTKEELRQEAEAEADKVIIGSGMDRTSVIHLKHLLVTMYIQGATKVTKELEAQIEKMKRCEICKHYRWNHCSYEINISEDCIQNKLKHFELKEIKENDNRSCGKRD